MRRAWRWLRAPFSAHPVLAVLGLLVPPVLVLGSAIASEILQDALDRDWDAWDEHQGTIQLGLVAVSLLLALLLRASPATRPVGAGMLRGLLVVGLVALVVALFWLALVALWVGGCTAAGGC